MSDDQAIRDVMCDCAEPQSSGSLNGGGEVCLACGDLITVPREDLKAIRQWADDLEAGDE